MQKHIYGFTLVEVIVTITIVSILTSIGFFSYNEYIPNARNAQREQDAAQLTTSFKTYYSKKGRYPTPVDSFTIQYNGGDIAKQGLLNNKMPLSTIDKIPTDPRNQKPYIYAITNNAQEFQIGLTMEHGTGRGKALVRGDYSSVSKNTVPTILLANPNIANNINVGAITDGFIFDNQTVNLPYTFSDSESVYGKLPLNTGINSDDYWQNSDFRTCAEIDDAKKLLPNITQYQVLNDDGELENITCP